MIKQRTFFIFTLFLFAILTSNAQISMKKTDDGILITENNQAVFQYNTVHKSMKGDYTRTNYIHPLYSLKGKVLTEDFPSDHPHQRGIFWAWHQVWIGDKRIGDPWDISHFEQSIEEVEFMKQVNGTAIVRTEVNWLSDLWKKDGRELPYLKERTSITIWPKVGQYRKIDFEIRLLALENDLRLGGSENEAGYGGFSVRMILPDDVTFSGPAGVVKPDQNAVHSLGFVNVSGSFEPENKAGGIVIVDHAGNPGYPQSWILRDKNSMQNAAWPGNETVTISTTEPLILKYTLLVYSGKMNARKIGKIMQP